jgi:hypothetical protein
VLEQLAKPMDASSLWKVGFFIGMAKAEPTLIWDAVRSSMETPGAPGIPNLNRTPSQVVPRRTDGCIDSELVR